MNPYAIFWICLSPLSKLDYFWTLMLFIGGTLWVYLFFYPNKFFSFYFKIYRPTYLILTCWFSYIIYLLFKLIFLLPPFFYPFISNYCFYYGSNSSSYSCYYSGFFFYYIFFFLFKSISFYLLFLFSSNYEFANCLILFRSRYFLNS